MIIYKFLLNTALTLFIGLTLSVQSADINQLTDHQQWLKNKFNDQHNKLIPIVAVADMLFACNRANDYAYGKHTLNTYITKMSKERLAEKLVSCLGDASIKSALAIDFGLLGCFYDQLDELSETERDKRMETVKSAIASLSHEEKKKSFTQCVTDQAIAYLK